MHFTVHIVHIVHIVCRYLISFIDSQSYNIYCAKKLFSQEEKPKTMEEKIEVWIVCWSHFFAPLSDRIFDPDLQSNLLTYYTFRCPKKAKWRHSGVKIICIASPQLIQRDSCRVRNNIYLWELFVIHAVHELLLKKWLVCTGAHYELWVKFGYISNFSDLLLLN